LTTVWLSSLLESEVAGTAATIAVGAGAAESVPVVAATQRTAKDAISITAEL
jgi:hypothetical protein